LLQPVLFAPLVLETADSQCQLHTLRGVIALTCDEQPSRFTQHMSQLYLRVAMSTLQGTQANWKGLSPWLVETEDNEVSAKLELITGDRHDMKPSTFTGVWTAYRNRNCDRDEAKDKKKEQEKAKDKTKDKDKDETKKEPWVSASRRCGAVLLRSTHV
jgi:hypothetical protein